MEDETQGYGRAREPGDATDGPENSAETTARQTATGTMSAQDERTWSMLSHLSVLAWPVTGFLPVAPLLIWVLYKDRSPRVGFHAAQSFWYQLAWLVILVVGWFITFILSFILIGLLLVPVMAVASLAPFVHGCYAAYKVNQGADYRYPFVADRIGGGRRAL